MALSHFDRFLLDATVLDETQRPLGPDCLYGLYTSWYLLHNIAPVADLTFRAAMERRRMVGQAARDDILASYPDPA